MYTVLHFHIAHTCLEPFAELPMVVFKSIEEKKARALQENSESMWSSVEAHFKQNKNVRAPFELHVPIEDIFYLVCVPALASTSQSEARRLPGDAQVSGPATCVVLYLLLSRHDC